MLQPPTRVANDKLVALQGRVLIKAGRRLSALVREEDIVARLGGDEFVAVFGKGADADLSTNSCTAHRLSASMSETIVLNQERSPWTGKLIYALKGRGPASSFGTCRTWGRTGRLC